MANARTALEALSAAPEDEDENLDDEGKGEDQGDEFDDDFADDVGHDLDFDDLGDDAGLSTAAESADKGYLLAHYGTSTDPQWIPFRNPDGVAIPGWEWLIAPSTCDEFSELQQKAQRKYAKGRGKNRAIPPDRSNQLLPIIMGKTIVRGIRGPWKLGPNGESVLKGVKVWVARQGVEKVSRIKMDVKFEVNEEGILLDTFKNRKQLLACVSGMMDRAWEDAQELADQVGGDTGGEVGNS